LLNSLKKRGVSESKGQHRHWWEQLLIHRPLELQKALEGLRLKEISEKISKCWDEADWLSQLDQAHRNVLVFEHKDSRSLPLEAKSPEPPILPTSTLRKSAED